MSFRMLLHTEQHNSCSTYTSKYIALCSMNLHTHKIFFDLYTHLSTSRYIVWTYIHKKYFLIYIHISVYRTVQYERKYTKIFFYWLCPPHTIGWAGLKPIHQLAGLPLDKNQKFTCKIELNYIQHENEHWCLSWSLIYIHPWI